MFLDSSVTVLVGIGSRICSLLHLYVTPCQLMTLPCLYCVVLLKQIIGTYTADCSVQEAVLKLDREVFFCCISVQ